MEEKMITPYRQRKLQREEAVYRDFNELMKQPGAMKVAVTNAIMEKYGIAASATIYQIRKRVEKRLAAQKKEAR